MSNLRLLRLLKRARRDGRVNPVAVALILTEMRFRGPVLRLGEIGFALWLIYIRRREPRLTLGICQVSFNFWRKKFGTNNRRLFAAVFDDFANYAMCEFYLSHYIDKTTDQLLVRYNGRPSRLYRTLFYRNLGRAHLTITKLDAWPETSVIV
jgi:hypothetical protein